MTKNIILSLPLCTVLLVFGVADSQVAPEFQVEPESVVQAQGLNAVFRCLCPLAVHNWIINGSFITTEDQLPGFIRTPPRGNSSALLTIPATPEYNNTVVQCQAIISRTNEINLSRNATLQVQGYKIHINQVWFDKNQSGSKVITISWEAPFSLNLTTAEPDIQYCVDVYNVAGGGDEHLQSVCDITDTHYTFNVSDPDQLFNLTVTPRSNVEGSLNGTTSQPVQGYLCNAHPQIGEDNSQIVFTSNVDLNPATISYHLQQNDNLCRITKSYLNIKPFNKDDFYKCSLSSVANTDPNTRSLMLNTCGIERHKLYHLIIHEEYNGGETLSDWIEISTHDVQSSRVQNQSVHGQITITNSYLFETRDLGVLVILWSTIQPQDIIYRIGQRKTEETTITIDNLSSTQYSLFSYDLEPDGLPRSLPAASPQLTTLLSIEDALDQSFLPTDSLDASATSPESNICMRCSFSAPEVTGCVGVFHSAQLVSNLTLTVLTVEKSGGMNCSVDLEEGNYSIAVFGQEDSGLNESPSFVQTVFVSPPLPTSDSTGLVWLSLLVLLPIIIITTVMVVYFIIRKKNRKGFRVQPRNNGSTELTTQVHDVENPHSSSDDDTSRDHTSVVYPEVPNSADSHPPIWLGESQADVMEPPIKHSLGNDGVKDNEQSSSFLQHHSMIISNSQAKLTPHREQSGSAGMTTEEDSQSPHREQSGSAGMTTEEDSQSPHREQSDDGKNDERSSSPDALSVSQVQLTVHGEQSGSAGMVTVEDSQSLYLKPSQLKTNKELDKKLENSQAVMNQDKPKDIVGVNNGARKRGHPKANDITKITDKINDQLSNCACGSKFQVTNVSENKITYTCGNTTKSRGVKITSGNVFVRIGSSWETLEDFFTKQDPCRLRSRGPPKMKTKNAEKNTSTYI